MEINLAISLILLITALLFGSFSNVLIYRAVEKLSIISPGSFCPNCKTALKFFENIPVLSYILQAGKCRNCSQKISRRYPIVELLVTLISAPVIYKLIYLNPELTINPIRDSLEILFLELFISFAIALAFIDAKTFELPHQYTYSGILIALSYSYFYGDFTSSLISVGMVFFIFDLMTHFANKIYFKKNALAISPAALSFRLDFLHKYISWVYLAISALVLYLTINLQLDILNNIFIAIGILYIINDIFIDFFCLSSSKRKELYETEEEPADSPQTVMGGGDAAMAAFIAAIFSSVQTSLSLIWLAFPIALFITLSTRLIKNLSSKTKPQEILKKERVAFGISLAIALIVGIILRLVFDFNLETI